MANCPNDYCTLWVDTKLYLVPLVQNILPNYGTNPSNKSTVGRRNPGFPFLVQHSRGQGFPPINTMKAHTTVWGIQEYTLDEPDNIDCI